MSYLFIWLLVYLTVGVIIMITDYFLDWLDSRGDLAIRLTMLFSWGLITLFIINYGIWRIVLEIPDFIRKVIRELFSD